MLHRAILISDQGSMKGADEMTKKEAYMNKVNHVATITEYEIELIVFEQGQDTRYYKDLVLGRCYDEIGTKSLKIQFESVKRRIKNSRFDEILNTCIIPD